ncbi:MAG: hypothetical protein IJZ39_00780 [Oscillospiraceae bacterium]|nr:hypothetical protein [Oscillospiraceae bacterium]
MIWNSFLHSKQGRAGLCAFLIIAILLGLCVPGISLEAAEPENPLINEEILDITALQVGDHSDDPDSGDTTVENATEPEDSEISETEPDETKPQEPDPDETKPEENKPEDSESDDPDAGDGDEGQEDGNRGEEGGEEAQLDLAMVMTWYKYGTQPKTIVCGPSEAVAKTINTAQLVGNELKYTFSFTGTEAGNVEITAVHLKEGDGAYREASTNGEVVIALADANAERDYTFQVTAHLKKRDGQGNLAEKDITFTYVLHCHYALDLELELIWDKNNNTTGKMTCTANNKASRTVESNDLTENVFSYTPKLVGALAENAKIVKGEYMTASGGTGLLNVNGGSLILQSATGSDREVYYLTFEAQSMDEDGTAQTVRFHFTVVFVDTLDIRLSFTWLEKGITRRTHICQPGESVSTGIKNNQLSAGALKYEIALEGADHESARILNISYTSEGAGGGKLEQRGSLPMTLPDGFSSNAYIITVLALAGGQQMSFKIVLNYSMDVYLEMRYTAGGENRTVICENGKAKTADAIYDDQLEGGILSYTMSMAGADGSDLEITSVSCYQSGSGRTGSLGASDDIPLLLRNGKTGENTFTVTAEDRSGTVYEFRINIPYKHRGENTVKITANLTDGQVVINDTATNLSVNAWSEDADGTVIGYIPANGTDTKLIVTLDGEEIRYISSSGTASEYTLYPRNPETGDTNTHTLTIYAEDAYGNYGELTLTLKGQRNQAGQKTGTATIYIDMTVVGLGVVDSVSYEVLADEPISYVVAKAVLGQDTGEPFGAAANSLGWGGRYSGTLDSGFYLQSLTPGYAGNALDGSSWNQYGSTEEEILRAIDNRFGKGTGLATLWRCIYRNGLNKSSGSGGTYNEFDYTSGSGWLFSLDGTYFPGQSMSQYYLEDGDVLTLRYTLCYGWDVGGGTAGYGSTVGYCVTAVNGSYDINHQMETVEKEDGSVRHICRCCGLVEDCAHAHLTYMDLEDGTHIRFCDDCKTTIGDPEAHDWTCSEETHTCSGCGMAQTHTWKEIAGSNTATCTEAGTRMVSCTVCAEVREEESPAKGHSLNSRWNYTASEHYQKCSSCGEEMNRGQHQYVYDEGWEDYECSVCGVLHDWDVGCNGALTVKDATCKKIVHHCGGCGHDLVHEGTFEEYHAYADGVCIHCGAKDPDYTPPVTEPPVAPPPETDPPITQPPDGESPDPEE